MIPFPFSSSRTLTKRTSIDVKASSSILTMTFLRRRENSSNTNALIARTYSVVWSRSLGRGGVIKQRRPQIPELCGRRRLHSDRNMDYLAGVTDRSIIGDEPIRVFRYRCAHILSVSSRARIVTRGNSRETNRAPQVHPVVRSRSGR